MAQMAHVAQDRTGTAGVTDARSAHKRRGLRVAGIVPFGYAADPVTKQLVPSHLHVSEEENQRGQVSLFEYFVWSPKRPDPFVWSVDAGTPTPKTLPRCVEIFLGHDGQLTELPPRPRPPG
jgi:hypothetical protein